MAPVTNMQSDIQAAGVTYYLITGTCTVLRCLVPWNMSWILTR